MTSPRRAFSMVEIVVAIALLATLLLPMINLIRPDQDGIGPRLSAATHLLREVVEVAGALPRAKLYALVLEGAEAGSGFREVPLARLGVGVERAAADGAIRRMGTIEDLKARVFIRVGNHVMGQFGLDRLDFVLEFDDSRGPQQVVRSVVKRNTTELAALSELRQLRDVSELDDAAFHGFIRTIVSECQTLAVARVKPDSAYLVPVYPERLREFDPPVGSEEELLKRAPVDTDDQALTLSLGDFLSTNEPPRPPLKATTGICN